MLIKGEFRGGMMNGRGKYTWSNGIVYEGDFLNNEIIGTGMYIWPEKSRQASADSTRQPKAATYEGQVYKSLRHGFGTFKSAKNSIKYIGEWRMGKIYGKVSRFGSVSFLLSPRKYRPELINRYQFRAR